MTTESTETAETNRRRGGAVKLVLSAAVILVGMATVAVTSLALFTDTASVDANTFTTGTVDIATNPTTAAVTNLAMAPGDQVTAPMTVNNSGSLEFRYAVTSLTTEDVLASELVMTVKSGVATCDDTNWSLSGTTLYAGRLGSSGSDVIFGSVAAGADAGDRVLAAGGSEILCFNVTLPISASAGQGVTSTATLDFVAEQTANNP